MCPSASRQQSSVACTGFGYNDMAVNDEGAITGAFCSDPSCNNVHGFVRPLGGTIATFNSSGSRARVQPRNFFPHTPPSTIPSTSNAISPQPKRTARFALRRWTRGEPQSQRPDNS